MTFNVFFLFIATVLINNIISWIFFNWVSMNMMNLRNHEYISFFRCNPWKPGSMNLSSSMSTVNKLYLIPAWRWMQSDKNIYGHLDHIQKLEKIWDAIFLHTINIMPCVPNCIDINVIAWVAIFINQWFIHSNSSLLQDIKFHHLNHYKCTCNLRCVHTCTCTMYTQSKLWNTSTFQL